MLVRVEHVDPVVRGIGRGDDAVPVAIAEPDRLEQGVDPLRPRVVADQDLVRGLPPVDGGEGLVRQRRPDAQLAWP